MDPASLASLVSLQLTTLAVALAVTASTIHQPLTVILALPVELAAAD
jgi:hypothetical protein